MKVQWLCVAVCAVLWGGVYWVVSKLIEMPVADPQGIIIAAILAGFGFIAFLLAFFEPAIMRLMYGEFSNRNPWGY